MSRLIDLLMIFGGISLWCVFAFWLIRCHGPFAGWSKSAQCQRCGYILHNFDTPVWSSDKTCVKCGPDALWKRVTARPVGFRAYEVKG